jgi:hypothetical protein
VLSEDELRRWQDIEAELAREQRLVRLAKRLADRSTNSFIPRAAWLLWVTGSTVGLIIAIVGWATNDSSVGMAGIGILVLTVILAGMALMMIGITGMRRFAHG